MTTPIVRRRRQWPWILGIAIVLVISAVAITAYFVGRSSTLVSPTLSVSPTVAAGTVDACLGGTAATASTVSDAQAHADHSTGGAVAYAATFGRWIYQIPVPQDVDVVRSSNGLSDAQWASYQASADGWTGPTPVAATTLTGRYRVEEATSDRVRVTLVLPLVVDGAVLPTKRFVPTLTVEWLDGRWEITDAAGDNAGSDDLDNLGTQFEGGC